MSDTGINDNTKRARALRLIKTRITTEFSPGEIIPSERAMAEDLNLGRRSVHWALTVLEDQGYVHKLGPRTRAVSQPPHADLPVFRDLFILDTSYRHRQRLKTKDAPGWTRHLRLGIHDGLSSLGKYSIELNGNESSDDLIKAFSAAHPGGMFLTDANPDLQYRKKLFEIADQLNLPVVSNSDNEEDRRFDRVISDQEKGGYLLTRHLIERGCRKPVLFFETPKETWWIRDRRKGYEAAMNEAGLTPLDSIHIDLAVELRGGSSQKVMSRAKLFAGFLSSRLLNDEPADAILVPGDGAVPVVGMACELLNKTPGKDVLLTGYDNYWNDTDEYSALHIKPVATIDKKNYLTGHKSAELMLQRCNGELPPEPQIRKVEPELIVI